MSGSAAVLTATGLVCKTWLKLGARRVTLHGLPGLLSILNARNTGLLTVANHISVVDEPLVWGALPWRMYTKPSHMRWTLGAADICFTSRFRRAYFSAGQVLETFRANERAGIYQPAMDVAIQKLREGRWCHIFPEGRVTQGEDALRRFRWGVSRLLLETADVDVQVVPIWLQGFDQIMPETRGWPRFLPRLGAEIDVVFGEPITHRVRPLLDRYVASSADVAPVIAPPPPDYIGEADVLRQARIEIAALLRDEVTALGRRVQSQGPEAASAGR